MTFSRLAQYLSGLLVAALLIFLFLQSRLDTAHHEKTQIELLTLLEQEGALRQQIIELQIGLKRNYGGLIAHQRKMTSILDRLSAAQTATHTLPTPPALLQQLKQDITRQFDAIEIFKSENAVLRNAMLFTAQQIRRLIQAIEADPSIDMIDQLSAKARLYQLFSDIQRLNAGLLEDEQQFARSLAPLQETLSLILNQQQVIPLQKLMAQLTLMIPLKQTLSSATRQALSSRVSDRIQALYRQFNRDFSARQARANQYRIWLLVVSLTLLFYLAFTFFKLQKTSTRLAESLRELEFHKAAIDEHAIVSITDVRGHIIYANQKFCEISQYTQQELIGKNHRIVKSDEHDAAYFKDMWKTIARGKAWQGEFANRAKDGSIYWVASTVLPRLGANGKPWQYIGIRTDITAQKEAEQKVRLLARFPAENTEPVMRIDNTGQILFANQASDVLLEHWKTRVNASIPDEWKAVIQHTLLMNQPEEQELKIANNYFALTFSPIQGEHYVNLYARDISAVKRVEKHLNYQATHDQLTGLSNRYAFEMVLEDSLIEVQQEDINSILLYIDLDQFKIVNDTCGHIAGDELLRQVSRLLEQAIRDSDKLARLGGDEFGIILHNCELHYGEKIAQDILTHLTDYRFLWEDKSFEIGASIGLVEINNECDSIVSLMGNADVACYAAKNDGRHRLKIYHDDSEVSKQHEEIQWASRIPMALSKNRFVLFAQLIKPLAPSADDNLHYEILVRMLSDNGEPIPPGAFIPAAERYDLMQSIDLWIITEAIRALGIHLQRFAQSRLRISINLSGQSIGNEHLLDYIPELLDKYGVDPACVTFEITETAAISNLSSAIRFIHQLKQNGHDFALDDFGSGLSSFSYLKSLPVDLLKIDGAFIKDILTDPIDAAMVQAINQIGHVMNISTIAEFVENADIEKRLQQIGIDYAQGYHIEAPRPFSDVLAEDEKKYRKKSSLKG